MDVLTFDPYAESVQEDPYRVFAHLRRNAPVSYDEKHDWWVVTKFDDIRAITTDPETYISGKGITLEDDELSVMMPNMIISDPPRHTHLRKLVSKAFTPRRVGAMEDPIRQLANELLDEVVGQEQFDAQRELAGPVPTTVIANMIGVPKEDRQKFRDWSDALISITSHQEGDRETALAKAAELYGYFENVIEDRRANPRDDLASAIVHAEIDGERLTHEEVLGSLFILLVAGNETTTNLIGNAIVLLEQYPDQRARLVEDPSLLGNAVREIVRFEPSVQVLCRTTTRPTELRGVQLPADAKIVLAWASASRDEDVYQDPDVFDVGRGITDLLAFGHGAHYCLGSSLAQLETRVLLEVLLDRLPDYRIVGELERVPSATIRGWRSIPVAPS